MEVRQSSSWDTKFINMAREVSTWSKDTTKIGAIAVNDSHRVLSVGYNGFPRGIADTEQRYSDRETKLKYVIHAEENCIFNAAYEGVCLHGATLYVYGLPVCSRCGPRLVQTGVKRVVMQVIAGARQSWLDEWDFTKKVFDEAGVEYEFVCEETK